MAIFNQVPVLDKGFVAYVSVGLPTKEMNKLSHHYFKAQLPRELIDFGNITMVIKCPLFVKVYLMQEFGINMLNVQPADKQATIETYLPNVAEIGCNEVTTSQDIREHMDQTSQALEITVKGYQDDGCDHYISQVNLPLSVYNEVIANGNLPQWVRFLKKKNLPKPVAAYQEAIFQLIKADYPNINLLMNKVV